ncbi:MAG TPA: HepT-like ribonuclease domain-containing protein [Thermoanaerobaculia bacterium]|nr:HepT-like ribonuclease domain-containing protein [Thermoanaerobaculia bacterium]
MRREPRAYLWDVREAADTILEFTRGLALDDYLADRKLRSAVERQFEILGEALNQLSKVAPEIAARIPDVPQIVAFRNLLIHGYATVDHPTVWETVQSQVPALRNCVADLLGAYDTAGA